jgi:hypothetical protein
VFHTDRGACTTSSPGKAELTGIDIKDSALYFRMHAFLGLEVQSKIGGVAT